MKRYDLYFNKLKNDKPYNVSKKYFYAEIILDISFLILFFTGYNQLSAVIFIAGYFLKERIFGSENAGIFFKQQILVLQRIFGFILLLSLINSNYILGYIGLSSYVLLFCFSIIPLQTLDRKFIKENMDKIIEWDNIFWKTFKMNPVGFNIVDIVIGIGVLMNFKILTLLILPLMLIIITIYNFRIFLFDRGLS